MTFASNLQAKEQREALIGQLPPVEKYKAEGNEFFKISKFPEAIDCVCALYVIGRLSVVHQGYQCRWSQG